MTSSSDLSDRGANAATYPPEIPPKIPVCLVQKNKEFRQIFVPLIPWYFYQEHQPAVHYTLNQW